MSGSILDTDMTTVGRRLRDGWTWWIEELASMVPPRIRRPSAMRGLVAWVGSEGRLAFTRNGEPAAEPIDAGTAAAVVIPPALCLTRSIAVPALHDADVRRVVALEMDRLMPFPPGTAFVDLDTGLPAPGGAQREVTIAALPKTIAAEVAATAEGAGLEMVALGTTGPDGEIRFDFLPALRAERGEPDAGRGRRFWWRAVAVAFLLNIALLIARDVVATRNFEKLVAAHADVANSVRTVRRRIIAEDAWRHGLAARRAARDPLALLGDVSRGVPDGAWLQRLTREGDEVRLIGFRRPAVDVIAALRRQPGFIAVRATTTDVLAPTPIGQPFDITFRVSGLGR